MQDDGAMIDEPKMIPLSDQPAFKAAFRRARLVEAVKKALRAYGPGPIDRYVWPEIFVDSILAIEHSEVDAAVAEIDAAYLKAKGAREAPE